MKPLLTLISFLLLHTVSAQDDSLFIHINKLSFPAKDTITFECAVPNYSQRHLATATLNVWIESLEDKKIWKYRYPVINGKAEAALAISDSIKPGKYAINFILQQGLFKLDGTLRNNYSYNKINYLMLTKTKESYFNAVELNERGDFNLKNIVFENEAYFIFTPGGKKKSNDLFISIHAPLDSLFSPRGIFTQVIDVKPELQKNTVATGTYRFNFDKTYANTTLPNVTVYAKAKTKQEEFEKNFVSGNFGNATRTFDGLDDASIANTPNIVTFLLGRIPGLRTEDDGTIFWRNQSVAIFIDEYRVENFELQYINSYDIASIKFYQSASGITPGAGPAIAIYLKRGAEDNNKTRRYRFLVKGYTPIEEEWK